MEESEQCKLFVGGVSWVTTEEILKEHFSKYGTVASTVIARDRNTGSPRGFAFVSFTDSSAVAKALEEETHNILGRTVCSHLIPLFVLFFCWVLLIKL